MKKYIFLFLILSVQALAQTANNNDWFWQYPKPQGNTLYDIHVFNKDTAIAVGELGTIIKTTDGGLNWDVQHHACGVSTNLNCVQFIDELNGWTVGGGGVALKTIDGGETWQKIKTDTSLTYHVVHFVDKDTGIVAGESGIVLRTTNGGNTWDTKKMDDYIGYGWLDIFDLYSITFTDKQTGWIVGYGYYGNEVYKTTDSGRSWQWLDQIVQPRIFDRLNDISFIDKNTGFIVGDMGVFLKTTDGGNSWQNLNLWDKYQKEEYQYLGSVYFADSNTGWITGNGFIIETSDGGINWDKVNPNQFTEETVRKIRFKDNNSGWAVGGMGVIYRTTDRGVNWIAQREKRYQFNSIYFTDEHTGWAVGEKGVILHTSNGGDTWEKQNQNDSLIFNSLQVFDTNNIIIVGEKFDNGHYINSIVVLTNDGGRSWQKHIDTLGALNSISFPTRNTGWIVGKGIYKTTDGGLSWQSQSNLFGLRHVQFIDEGTGWVEMASDNNLYKTTDGGKNWKSQLINPNFTANSFYFINPNVGWAAGVGYNPVTYYWDKYIFKTTDGGNSWIQCSDVPNSVYNSVQFINENIGWAVGSNSYTGKIIKTVDGGNTWVEQQCPTRNALSNIFMLNDNTGWVLGGDIFKTTDGGGVMDVKDINYYKNNIPSKIELYQNYPNPFNPSTIISYHISKAGFVSLKVYDILGRVVDRLVDKWQTTGNYRIDWNPKNLSSGVFFYMLRVGEFSITKKMLLLR